MFCAVIVFESADPQFGHASAFLLDGLRCRSTYRWAIGQCIGYQPLFLAQLGNGVGGHARRSRDNVIQIVSRLSSRRDSDVADVSIARGSSPLCLLV